ncbi:MAG: KdsC family phosphatase [Phycisphaerae bacterium]
MTTVSPDFRFDASHERAQNIRCLVLDVDGVLTSGKLIYDGAGDCSREFDIHDGFGIRLFREFIGPVALISGKASEATAARARELKIEHLFLGSKDKRGDLDKLMQRIGCTAAEVAAMGDDWPDLPMLQRCGLAIAPANAVREVRDAAHWVTTRSGGDGAVREAIERILQGQRRWQDALQRYGATGPANQAVRETA